MTTTEASVAEELDNDPIEIIEPDQEQYVRAAGERIRVATATVVFLVTLLAAAILRSVISGAEQDVVYLTSLVPAPVASILTAVSRTIAFLGPILVAGILLLYIRRLRVAIMVVAAAGLAAGAMWLISKLLAVNVVLPANLGELRTIKYPGPSFLASASAIATVLGPWLPRLARRLAIAVIAAVAFSRIASGQYVPFEVAVALVLGWLVGVVLLAVLGSPNRRPKGESVGAALRRAGIDVVRLELVENRARGAILYHARTREGITHFVKVFSSDQHDADVIVQFYRWIRLRDAADERPFSTLRRSVEHEALLALKSADDGIRTARMLAVAEVEPEGMLLAFEYVAGESLAGEGPDRIDDELLRRIWEIARALRERHIAHRDLRLEHILVDDDGVPTVVDFSFGELAASPEQLRSDAAELLCATAIEVGPERAVAAAADVLGIDVLGDIVTRLQPLALTRETRKDLAEHDGLLGQLQAEVQRAAGLDEIQYEELARIKPRTFVTVIVMSIALYALLPRLAEVQDIGSELANAKWYWAIPMVLFMVTTWFGAGLGVVGSVPDRVPYLPVTSAQVAASFVDTLAPASVGGMALNTRFLQKRGVEPGVAVAGVGLNAVAGFVVHIVLLGVFILWAGADAGSTTTDTGISAPSARTTLLVLAALVAIITGAWTIPQSRKLARTKLIPLARDAVHGIGQLARKPRKVVALFGGSIVVTFGFYGALLCSVQAFGGQATPAQIGVAYLVAFAVAILAPTPGGLGALEAALITGFQRIGMTAEVAVSSVFLFRVMTFWLPVLPGWITFGMLQRRGDI